jgi:putative hydrolase of HD superfamily
MSKIDLLTSAGKLKRVKRQGWLDAGIPRSEVESVADHSFRVALMAAFLVQSGSLDAPKTIRMALIHDLAESTVGDLTPRSGVSRRKKALMEEEAIRRLGSKELLSLWEEYEEGRTPEARLVGEMDILERVMQAREYSKRHPDKNLAHFWKDWKKMIRTPELRALAGRS